MSLKASPPTEVQIIRKIQTLSIQSHSRQSQLRLSIGDDAAAFQSRKAFLTLVSSDALVEGIHFDLKYYSPEDLGWKALAVNLSDIAAMGGTPLYFMTSVALPQDKASHFLVRVYHGMLQLAAQRRVALIGGDTCSSPTGIFLDVTVIGEVKSSEMVTRQGAQPGDALFVTGELGASAMGLDLLKHTSGARKVLPEAVDRHLRPVPRCHIGRFLASRHYASAMIDISDGLSTDLHHLCEQSEVGAIIDADRVPIPKLNPKAASRLSKALIDYGMNGGEDYELLFAVPAKMKARIPLSIQGVRVWEVGYTTEKAGSCWIKVGGSLRRLSAAGFDHFAS